MRADSGRTRAEAPRHGRASVFIGEICGYGLPAVVGRLLTVRPDFVFRRGGLVVFVDGRFWHGCPIHYTWPKARRAFWDAKIAARYAAGCVLHVWEHALAPREIARTLARVRRAVGSACGLRRRVSRAARCGTRLERTLARLRRAIG